MYPNVDSTAVDLSQFKKIEAVFDCVYNPMDTEFTLHAKELGIRVAVTGLEMLVAQAKRALEHFKDIQIDDEEIDRIYREILTETANLITTCQDISVLNELSSKIQKPVVYFKQEQQAIENNQILVIDKNDVIKYHKRLISNGFIVDGDSTALILEHFKKSIQNY